MEVKEKEIVKKWFPVLLKEDPDFREEVMGHLTDVLATKDDIAKILSKLEEYSRILEEHTKRIDRFERILSAIGARWGMIAEETFREGMRGITVALVDIEKCEEQPQLAYQINVLTAENIAKALRGKDIRLVHISTDHFFDGRQSFYTEDHPPQLL